LQDHANMNAPRSPAPLAAVRQPADAAIARMLRAAGERLLAHADQLESGTASAADVAGRPECVGRPGRTATVAAAAYDLAVIPRDDLATLAADLRYALALIGAPAPDPVQAARLQAMLATIPADIALVDEEGRILTTNRVRPGRRDEGEQPGDAGERYIERYLSVDDAVPADAWEAADGLKAVLAGERPALTIEYPWPPGIERRWLRLVVSPLVPGRPGPAVVVRMDITDRKLEQDAVRRSEEKYRLLFRRNPHPMWVYDAQTLRFLEVNRAAVEQYGWSVEEFQAMTIADIRSEADRVQLDHVLASNQGGLASAGIWRHRTRGGGERLVEIHSDALSIEGRAARIVMAVDVTEREESARRQRVSEERLGYLAQVTVDTIWDWDLTSNTLWWSQNLLQQFGYKDEANQVGIEVWMERVHPDDRQRVDQSLQAAFSGNAQEWQHSYRFRRQDGSYAEILDRGFVLRDDDGKAVRMVGGMSDVSEQRALAEQLRQAQRLEAVGQLTGGVAHDFNNLLTVMMGNAELLHDALHESQPGLAELAGMIGTAAGMGAELTRRLLAFARKQALQPQAVDPRRLVEEFEPLLRRTLGAGVQISTDFGEGVWQALADPGQLENALLNLCLNARDAMADGGRLLIETGNVVLDEDYMQLHPDVQPGEYVMLAVSDTGCGMAPDQLARVFEPFYTTKRKGLGTGLGMSMVYGFVRQSRGHVTVYSEPGVGTAVRLYLPRLQDHQSQPAAPAAIAVPNGGGELVLLVEDDAMVRSYATRQLEGLGYRVLGASDGEEALALLVQRADIDLLFTDVVMPGGMTGRQLADAARVHRPGLPVVFASGYSENAIVHHGRLDPGVLLLSKPYRRAQLAAKLRQALALAPPVGVRPVAAATAVPTSVSSTATSVARAVADVVGADGRTSAATSVATSVATSQVTAAGVDAATDAATSAAVDASSQGAANAARTAVENGGAVHAAIDTHVDTHVDTHIETSVVAGADTDAFESGTGADVRAVASGDASVEAVTTGGGASAEHTHDSAAPPPAARTGAFPPISPGSSA
jgi:PAS domain S-box-containing protein